MDVYYVYFVCVCVCVYWVGDDHDNVILKVKFLNIPMRLVGLENEVL